MSEARLNETAMIIECLDLVVPQKKHEELRQVIRFLLGPLQVAPGLVRCWFFQEVTNADSFRLECYWKTQDDLTRHMQSDTYKELLVLMELGSERPRIQFHTVSQTRGLDLVVAARTM